MNLHLLFIFILTITLFMTSFINFSYADAMPEELHRYIDTALKNNHGIKATYEQWKAANTRPVQAGALPEPRFSFTYFIQEVETRVGAQKKRFGIFQKFPLGGKRKLKAMKARAASKIDWRKLQTMRLAVTRKLKKAYYEYAFLARSIEITKEVKLLLAQLEEVAQIKYQSGTGSHTSIVQLQVELAKLEDRIASMMDLRKARSTLLSSIINEAGTDRILPWPGKIHAVKFSRPAKELIQQMKVKNPELQLYDHLGEIADYERKLARKKRVPDLTVGLIAMETGNRIDANPIDNGKGPYGVTFAFNLPIRTRAYAAAEREARHRYLKARYKKRNLMENLLAKVQLSLFQFNDSWRKINLYQNSLLPKAEQAIQVSQEGFATGDVDFLNVIDTVRTILDFQLAYERAVIDQRIALAKLETLVGHSLIKYLKTVRKKEPVLKGNKK